MQIPSSNITIITRAFVNMTQISCNIEYLGYKFVLISLSLDYGCLITGPIILVKNYEVEFIGLDEIDNHFSDQISVVSSGNYV